MRRSFILTSAAVATLVVIAAATAAYGYWTVAGDGAGQAATGSLESVVVTTTEVTPTTALLPGQSAAAAFAVTNPNHFAVTIAAVSGNGPVTVSGGSGCDAANAHVTFSDQTGLEIAVSADAVDQHVELSAAVTMADSSASGCQSATFHIPITVATRVS